MQQSQCWCCAERPDGLQHMRAENFESDGFVRDTLVETGDPVCLALDLLSDQLKICEPLACSQGMQLSA